MMAMAILGYRKYTAWNVIKFTQIVAADFRFSIPDENLLTVIACECA